LVYRPQASVAGRYESGSFGRFSLPRGLSSPDQIAALEDGSVVVHAIKKGGIFGRDRSYFVRIWQRSQHEYDAGSSFTVVEHMVARGKKVWFLAFSPSGQVLGSFDFGQPQPNTADAAYPALRCIRRGCSRGRVGGAGIAVRV
jgi:hypothetical protein